MQWRDKKIDNCQKFNFQNLIFSHFVQLNSQSSEYYIYFRRCVPEMFVISHSATFCIYIPGKRGFCFHYYFAVYDEFKYSDTFWLADLIRLFVYNTISLPSLCKLIWRHWKCLSDIFLSRLWVRLSILSQLSIIQYIGLCVFSLPISLVMIEIIYTLSYYHLQIGSMNYYPLFRATSWSNGMRCMSLYSYCIISEIANIIAVICLSHPAIK